VVSGLEWLKTRWRLRHSIPMTTWLVLGFWTFTLVTMVAMIVTVGMMLWRWGDQQIDSDLSRRVSALRTILENDEAYLNREIVTVASLEGMNKALETQDQDLLVRLLEPVIASHRLNVLYVLGPDGQVLASLGKDATSEERLVHTPLVQQGFKGAHASGLMKLNGAIWMTAVLPHRSANGDLNSVIVLATKVDDDYLRGIRSTLGPDVALVWGDTTVFSLGVALPKSLKPTFEMVAAGGEEIFFSDVTVNHTHYRVASTNPSWYSGHPLSVHLFQPTAALERELKNALARAVAITLLFVAGGSMLVYLYAHSVTDPLHRLAEAAQTIAGGELDKPVQVEGRDEVGQLARAFENMRVKVQAMLESEQRWAADLEEKVRQRTAELQKLSESRNQLLHKTISAQEEERRRVARDLHDETSQALVALITNLAVLQRLPPEEAHKHLPEFRESVVKALKEVNRIVLNLRPTLLDDYGLIPALSWYAEERLAGSGTQVDVVAQDGAQDVKLPPVVETTLFRVGQEAIANAAKYAQASVVRLRLQVENTGEEPTAILEIEDDGRGFDLEAAHHPTQGGRPPLGLMGMEERVRLHGGRLEIRSVPAEGTCVCAVVPLTPQREEGDSGA